LARTFLEILKAINETNRAKVSDLAGQVAFRIRTMEAKLWHLFAGYHRTTLGKVSSDLNG